VKEEPVKEHDNVIKSKKKQSISKQLRTLVWNEYIGDLIAAHKCLCCKKTIIKNTDFICGHVIAESKGGSLEISNLRPICNGCNSSMQSKNMIDYVKENGFYIG